MATIFHIRAENPNPDSRSGELQVNRSFGQFEKSLKGASFSRPNKGPLPSAPEVLIYDSIDEVPEPSKVSMISLYDGKVVTLTAGYNPRQIAINPAHDEAVFVETEKGQEQAPAPDGMHYAVDEASPEMLMNTIADEHKWKINSNPAKLSNDESLSMDHQIISFRRNEYDQLSDEDKERASQILTEVFSRHPLYLARRLENPDPSLFVQEGDTANQRKEKLDGTAGPRAAENGHRFVLTTPVHTNTDNEHFHVWSSRFAVSPEDREVSSALKIGQNHIVSKVYLPAVNQALAGAGINLKFDTAREEMKNLTQIERETAQKHVEAVTRAIVGGGNEEEFETSPEEVIPVPRAKASEALIREGIKAGERKMVSLQRELQESAIYVATLKEADLAIIAERKAQTELLKSQEIVDELTQEKITLIQENEGQADIISRMESELVSTKSYLEDVKNDLEEEQQARQNAENVAKDRLETLEEREKEIESLDAKVDELTSENASLTQDNDNKSVIISRMETELTNAKEELKNFFEQMEDIFDLDAQPETLEEAKQALKLEHESAENLKKDLDNILNNQEGLLIALEEMGVHLDSNTDYVDKELAHRISDFAENKLMAYQNEAQKAQAEALTAQAEQAQKAQAEALEAQRIALEGKAEADAKNALEDFNRRFEALQSRADLAVAQVETLEAGKEEDDADKLAILRALRDAGVNLERQEDGSYKATPRPEKKNTPKGPGE